MVLFHHEDESGTDGSMCHFSDVKFIGLLKITEMFAQTETLVSSLMGKVETISGATSGAFTSEVNVNNEMKKMKQTSNTLSLQLFFMKVPLHENVFRMCF